MGEKKVRREIPGFGTTKQTWLNRFRPARVDVHCRKGRREIRKERKKGHPGSEGTTKKHRHVERSARASKISSEPFSLYADPKNGCAWSRKCSREEIRGRGVRNEKSRKNQKAGRSTSLSARQSDQRGRKEYRREGQRKKKRKRASPRNTCVGKKKRGKMRTEDK